MEENEYKFPDEQASVEDEEIELEVIDDTPEEDRGREPLPKELVQELEDDQLEEYSDKVKTRLKQMKKVWHDERREKETARREHQAALDYASKVLEENRQLKSRVSAGERTFVDTAKGAAALELDVAKRAYKEAYESGDSDRLVEAQEKLNEAQFKAHQVRNFVPTPLQEENTPVQTQPQAQIPRPDNKTLAWQERNTWFGTDSVMTGAALGLHNDLVAQYGPSYATTDEYWNKIDATMRQSFPQKFDASASAPQKGSRTPPPTVVASASRSTAPKKVALKQSELSTAKRLGLTPEQYAREKLKLESKNG